MSSFAYKENLNLDLSGKIAVITGGTQGIGAGVAVRYAKAGASVYIVGRNEKLGEEMIGELKKAAKDEGQRFEFVKGDVGLVSNIKELANTLIKKAGPRGIDYLVLCAGGPTTGTLSLNSEGHSSQFTVQVLGRFGLAYLLAKKGVVKESILSVCVAGKGPVAPDLEDVELIKASKEGRFNVLSCRRQTAGILDAVTAQFAIEFPSIRTLHTFPGIVTTNIFSNSGFPFAFVLIWNALSPVLSRTIGNSPEGYAEIPVYLTANSKRKSKELVYSNEKLQDVKQSWVEDREVTKKVWDELVAIIEG